MQRESSGVSGLNRMASGLIHLSDSNAGDERGTFIDFFGEPGDPRVKSAIKEDSGSFPGTVGNLGRRWMRGGSGSIGRGKR